MGLAYLDIPAKSGKPACRVQTDLIHLLSRLCDLAYSDNLALSSRKDNKKFLKKFDRICFRNEGMIGIIIANDEQIIVAFRGSRLAKPHSQGDVKWYAAKKILKKIGNLKPDEILRATNIALFDSPVDAPLGGKISKVAMDTLETVPDYPEDSRYESETNFYEAMRSELVTMTKAHPNAAISITGHSLGGMIACAFTAKYLESSPEAKIDGLFTFAQPRTGNGEFNEALEKRLNGPYLRFAIDRDIFAGATHNPDSPLTWLRGNSGDTRRIHGGVAVIYYTDKNRFEGKDTNEKYGYAELHEQPHIKVLVSDLEEKIRTAGRTPLRRHQIVSHKKVAKFVRNEAEESNIRVYEPKQKVTPETREPGPHIEAAEIIAPLLSTSPDAYSLA